MRPIGALRNSASKLAPTRFGDGVLTVLASVYITLPMLQLSLTFI